VSIFSLRFQAKENVKNVFARYNDPVKRAEDQLSIEKKIIERGSIDIKMPGLIDPYFMRDNLLAFFADRLKVYLKGQGARHDLIDAVFSLEGQDDLLLIVRRVEALGEFLETEDGAALLAGIKRASNILRIEEKKDEHSFDDFPVDENLFEQGEERALFKAMGKMEREAGEALEREDFTAAMKALAELKGPVDDFFEQVTVNADDEKLRRNRLALLARIRRATLSIADFSKIEE